MLRLTGMHLKSKWKWISTKIIYIINQRLCSLSTQYCLKSSFKCIKRRYLLTHNTNDWKSDEKSPNFSGDCINRAHRIGPDYACYKLLEKCRSIMVRFVSFKHQTLFYRQRTSLKIVRVKIDLTKRRYEV